ncbi:phosphoenolpyruvate--protein phosphotransferase [Candidatus Poribacteria bacterium]|nr:phosphoenolpyruvate--protein phosphotransferase [Candidatus Poribacteria bacterium]
MFPLLWSNAMCAASEEGSDESEEESSVVLSGIAASPGVAMGPVFLYAPDDWGVPETSIDPEECPKELARFRSAVERSRDAILELRDRLGLEQADTPGGFIFQAHTSLLDDPLFHERVGDEIRRNLRSAESAVVAFADHITAAFRALDDRFFQEKAADVQDVVRHVLYNLQENRATSSLADRLADREPCIVLAPALLPSDTLLLPRERVLGFATEGGSRLSHVSILANALQIPAAVGLGTGIESAYDGDLAILDGANGSLILRPTPEQIDAYHRSRADREAFQLELHEVLEEAAVTLDEQTIQLLVNIELPEELDACRRYGADGVGLYRTEYGYLYRDALPSEDELYEDYRRVIEQQASRLVTIRTIDLGGDKVAPFLTEAEGLEDIAHLRATRLCLRHPELWMPQLRAIWRAALHGEVRVMFPLIPGLSELRAAKQAVAEARAALVREGIPCAESLTLGVMIELPSAVVVSDLLAQEADFFSIGTNDLIPYSLGIDRTHMDVTMVSEPYHPGILRSIRQVVQEADRAGIPVTLCGEMAGDPFCVLPLLGTGIRSLSMHPAAIPEIKRIIRNTTIPEAQSLANNLFRLPTAQAVDYEVHRYMADRYGHLLAQAVPAPGAWAGDDRDATG